MRMPHIVIWGAQSAAALSSEPDKRRREHVTAVTRRPRGAAIFLEVRVGLSFRTSIFLEVAWLWFDEHFFRSVWQRQSLLPNQYRNLYFYRCGGHFFSDSRLSHHSGLRAWFGKGKKGGAGGGGWDRYNTKGERIGKCGDRKKGEGKPKCLSKARAASLRASGGKKAIAAAVRRKRSKDKNPERRGKAINVSNKKKK